ncbi:AAA family ATPase (plasmid) [Bacillus velezensis]|uniref:AAA family ATPase n=1 Tax=Bacillus velezensis TaxID=492670 RepID=UPI0019570251|nr:AAA family ATPase [Bacillus velezensis]QRV11374.1 AAA family ATPase [Bacillus velezensis]
MSFFRKPSTRKLGAKILLMGPPGCGKTQCGLSFPKIYALDSETGIAFYEGEAENLLGIANTQDFNELNEAMDEISDMVKEDPSSIGSFMIDSETKFYQNLTDAALTLEEKKARSKGKDEMDTNISVRGWGRIKSVATRLQNLKLDLSAKGVNVISIAQSEDVKEKIGDNYIKVGEKPVMAKGAPFDYDIVIKLFVEKDTKGEFHYKGEILKDRTKVCKVGQVIDNPSYLVWKDHLEGRKGERIDSNLADDAEKAITTLESKVNKEEMNTVDRFRELVSKSDAHKEATLKLVKEAKIANPLSPKDAKEVQKIDEIIKEVEALELDKPA